MVFLTDSVAAPAVDSAPVASFSLSTRRDGSATSQKTSAPFHEQAIEDVRPRSGSVITGFAQIMCAVCGSGILALPNAMAALGWVAGLVLLIVFAAITYYTTLLLIDCYEYQGVRHATYYDAVKHMLPGTPWPVCMQILQQSNLVLTALGYAITAGTALQKVAAVLVPEGTDPSSILLQTWFWIFIFSCVELLICQLRTLEDLGWVSIVGTIMAFTYSIIAIYLGFLNWGTSPGTMGGAFTTPTAKMWAIFNALGTIAFAYSFSFLTIEITDTLKHPSEVTMSHSLTAAVPTMTGIFLLVAVPNYAAMGNTVAGYLFDSYSSPAWLIVVANMCVVVHLAGAYAVFSAPFFRLVEVSALRMAKARHVSTSAGMRTTIRVLWRAVYVGAIAVVAACLPFFSDFVALLGGIAFWPLTIGLPIALWSIKHKPGMWTRIALQILSMLCLAVTIVAVVGSVQAIVSDSITYHVGF